MQTVVVDLDKRDAAEDELLCRAIEFVKACGGIAYAAGSVELKVISKEHFCLRIHCIGYAPPLPGAPADG